MQVTPVSDHVGAHFSNVNNYPGQHRLMHRITLAGDELNGVAS